MSIRSLLVMALCCGLVHQAAADDDEREKRGSGIVDGRPVQNGIGIEVGVITNSGMSEYGDDYANLAPSANGLFIRDRNGLTSRMVIGLVIAVAGAMAASGPKSVESHSYVSGDYVVTETTTTYYSEEEKAQMRENTSKTIGSLFTARYSDFELHLYSRDKFGHSDTSGYKLNFFVGGGSATFGYETGFGFGHADSLVNSDRFGMTRIGWKYLGMPFRLTKMIGPVRMALTYEWNWLKYGLDKETERHVHLVTGQNGAPDMQQVQSGSHPWHLEASVAILKRVAVSGGITAQTLHPELGYFATAGFFF